jgi:hypothetical protein
MSNRLLNLCKQWPDRELINPQTPKITKVKAAYYKNLTIDLLEWASTLPNFDHWLLYKLTFLP